MKTFGEQTELHFSTNTTLATKQNLAEQWHGDVKMRGSNQVLLQKGVVLALEES